MHNKEVIVTGATGFVGQYVIPVLLERNFNVIAIARDKKKAKKGAKTNSARNKIFYTRMKQMFLAMISITQI